MTHSERCNQDALERISVCCGAAEHEYMVEFCSRCNNGAGFELWCSDCGEVVEETASPKRSAGVDSD